MKKVIFALVVAVSFVGFTAVPKIIFDTDMVTDYDDIGAMAVLHTLADEGKCEILAMASCTRDNQSVAAVEIINAFYGRADIPVGCSKELGVIGVPTKDPKRVGHYKYVRLAKEYPQWVKHLNSNDAPDANEVYRKVLAAAADKSVTFCSVGFLTNMRRLLETKGDKYSPLDGRELVAKKVKAWYVMGGHAPKGREYNIMHDAESAKIAFENWPTPIIVSEFVMGRNVYSGRGVTERTYSYRNPVKDIFTWCLPSRESVIAGKSWDKEVGGHCSWDQVTVLAAVYGPTHYFEVERGVFKLDDKGANVWIPDEKGKFQLLKQDVQRYPYRAVGAILDELIAREPLKYSRSL